MTLIKKKGWPCLVSKRLLAGGLLGLLVSLLLNGCTPATSPPTSAWQRHVLPNGLTVLLSPSQNAPVVSVQAWVGVGSAREDPKESGLAHIHEHMLFKGTTKYGLGEIARTIEGLGGNINAYTSFDNTVYYVDIAARYLENALEILSQALFQSTFDPEELAKEREVVLEELHRQQDTPAGSLTVDLFQLSYQTHPYKRPVIGFKETIAAATREQLLAFYKRWYVPNNITLVIAGDFETGTARDLLTKYFANQPKGALIKPALPSEPKQLALRFQQKTAPIQETHLTLSFKSTAFIDQDTPAVDLLTFILGEGESSRLWQRLREQEPLVYSIGVDSYTPADPGLIIVQARLDDVKLQPALTALVAELRRLQTQLVSQEELAKAKQMVLANHLYQKETANGRATNAGFFENVAGGVSYEERYLAAIASTTAAAVQAAAVKYFSSTQANLALLLPNSTSPDPALETETRRLFSVLALAASDISPLPANEGDNQIHKYRLANGVVILLKTNPGSKTVGLYATFIGGLRLETEQTQGINTLLAELLTKGTKTHTSLEIAQELEVDGSSLVGFSGRNSLGLSGTFLAANWESGFALAADVLQNFTLPSEEFTKEKMRQLAALKQRQDNLFEYTFFKLNERLFSGHPYRWSRLGTPTTINRLTLKELTTYAKRVLVPSNLVLAVVGDIDITAAAKLIQQTLTPWEGPHFIPPTITAPLPLSKEVWQQETMPKEQSQIMIGFLGTSIYDQDKDTLAVINAVLGGQGGRLFTRLRDEQGLAYQVTSFQVDGLEPGLFATYLASEPQKTTQALHGLRQEIKHLRDESVSETELERAKQYLIGSFERGLESNINQASTIALDELYQLGYGYHRQYAERIKRVGRADVRRLAQKYLDLDRAVYVLVGP